MWGNILPANKALRLDSGPCIFAWANGIFRLANKALRLDSCPRILVVGDDLLLVLVEDDFALSPLVDAVDLAKLGGILVEGVSAEGELLLGRGKRREGEREHEDGRGRETRRRKRSSRRRSVRW